MDRTKCYASVQRNRLRLRRFFEFMPWHVEEGRDECGDSEPYAVVQDDNDEVMGCHATREDADAQVAALYASEADGGEGDAAMHDCVDPENTGTCEQCGHPCDEHPMDMAAAAPADAEPERVTVNAVLCVEGFDTGDGRILEVGGWREDSLRMLPQTMWVQDTQSMWGHEGAVAVGTWDTMERLADGRRIYATGTIPLINDQARWARDQIREQVLRFVSIDVGAADVEYEIRAIDEDGWPVDVLAWFNNYEIMGATVVGQPAIAWAVCWLEGMDPPAEFTAALPDVPERVAEPEIIESDMPGDIIILASTPAAPTPDDPPEEWFRPSALHDALAELVLADGRAPHVRLEDALANGQRRVVGFVAPFGVCHIGMPGCVTAPRSRTDYAYFATQEAYARCCADCDDRDAERRIPAGVLTMGTTHASLALPASEAAYHYDHTGHAVARVAIGENEFGIWVAGVTLPGVDASRLALLNGANLSGDWRLLRGNLELVAALVCNVPGFPMTRPSAHYAVAASGDVVQTSLVGPAWPGVDEQVRLEAVAASGRPRRQREDPRFVELRRRQDAVESELAALRAEVRGMRTVTQALRPVAASALRATIGSNGDG